MTHHILHKGYLHKVLLNIHLFGFVLTLTKRGRKVVNYEAGKGGKTANILEFQDSSGTTIIKN